MRLVRTWSPAMNKPANNNLNQSKDTLHDDLASKLPFIDAEQEGGGDKPSASLLDSHKNGGSHDPYLEEHAHSATQSFLHDSYYPHLYYQDWHETEYDETDRLQDYYRNEAQDANSRYYEESYRNQAEYHQNVYHEPHREVQLPWFQDSRLTVNHGYEHGCLIPQDYSSLSSPKTDAPLLESIPYGATLESPGSDHVSGASYLLSENRLTVNQGDYASVVDSATMPVSVAHGYSNEPNQSLYTLLSEDIPTRLTVNHVGDHSFSISHENESVLGTRANASFAEGAQRPLTIDNSNNELLSDTSSLFGTDRLIVNREDFTNVIIPTEALASSVAQSSIHGSSANNHETLLADARLTVNREHGEGFSLPVNQGAVSSSKSKMPNSESGIADSILKDPEDSLLTEALHSSSRGGAEEHVTLAGTAALDALGVVGGVAANIGISVGGIAMQTVSSAAREDELIGRMDEGREIVFGAVSKEIGREHPLIGGGFLKETPTEKLIKERTAAEMLTREKSTPVDAKQFAEKLQKEKALNEKDLGLIGEDEKEIVAEGKGKDRDKKPTTKRERDLVAKKKLLKEAKLDAGKASALINPAKKVNDSLGKGANITKNVSVSSVSSVISKENEDVATLMSMKDAGKKGVNTAKNLARLPQKVAQRTRQVAHLIRAAWHAITHAVSAIAATGWPAILAVAGILLLAVVCVVVIVGSLVILDENQEISEVAALVAELDEQLEEEIHTYGQSGALNSSPIYYLDARETYGVTGENGEDMTFDVDLEDDVSDLRLVDASSVNVYTNPDGIIAYIDAKYSGEWQAGAASWKFTVDWNDKTYNIFDWENVPEFVQNGLNKIDKVQFKGDIEDVVEEYLAESYPDLDEDTAEDIGNAVADELANVIFDQQLQGINDEIVYQVINASVKQYKSDLELSGDELKTLNYEIMESVGALVGEQEPVALVYDEIVELHGLLNYWSEDYEHIDATSTFGGSGASGVSGTYNAYGYPNAAGYNADELANWDGYNEVSVYGISESGTTSVTGDGTRIANNWSDTTMAIACEGLQNEYFAYWTSAYKKLHPNSNQPVRITLYNPETEKTVTVEVRDCGGWRGFNSRYAGMNATRQWDLLPAVWLALGGTQSSGLMNVYWRVDNEAPLTGSAGAAAEVTIEEYPWEKETDNANGEITVDRATYIRHDIQDLMRNVPRIEKLLGRDNFASDAEFKAVINFVVMKLKDIMEPVLTAENILGNLYTDYFMTRRELGNPFGTAGDGTPAQWVVTKRFSPGYDDEFDKDATSVGIKPLNGDLSVYAIKDGTVVKVGEDSIAVNFVIDGDVNEQIRYQNLQNIQVSEGDEITTGTMLGKLTDTNSSLEISWYEVFTYVGDWDRQRGWAYCPSLFMQGFAGYEEPEEPIEYSGGSLRNLADCETIVDYAYSRLGCPYVWGATGPYVFDCSGLTQWCYAQAGIQIPRTSEEQYVTALLSGNVLLLDESLLQPGDILWKSGHVGIYIGYNQYIHAPHTGDVVKVSSGISFFTYAIRFA